MKVKAVNKKVTKALGAKVNHPEDGYGHYWVHYGNHILSWGACNGEGLEADASGFHIRREDDHSEPQTDYFAGYFVDNPTKMIHAVKPPPPKFRVGALIRFKDNKRSKRWGVEGKLGIVMQAKGGGTCDVRLNDGTGANLVLSTSHGMNSFYERDMELAKSNL